MIRLGLVAFISFFPSLSAQAKGRAAANTVEQLATITNDRSSDTNSLGLILDDQSAVLGLEFGSSNKSAQPEDFTVADLESANGATLVEDSGYKVFVLKGRIDQARGHGRLTLSFLNDGLSSSYKRCGIDLDRDSQGVWNLVNASGTVVTALHVVTWSMGISTVQGLCPDDATRAADQEN